MATAQIATNRRTANIILSFFWLILCSEQLEYFWVLVAFQKSRRITLKAKKM
jgi:hypothetical protein